MTANEAALSLDALSPDEQILVHNARSVAEFFREHIDPKMDDSAEQKKFLGNPAQYLTDAGCPVIPDFSPEQKQSLNTVLADQQLLTSTMSPGCWICSKGIETVICVVVAVGMTLTVVAITALGVALAPYTGGASIALALIADAGFAAGVYVLGPMIESLAGMVCQKMGSC
jgi:hypothetical protein